MKQWPTLLLPEKTDTETESVITAWKSKGGKIKQLAKYWLKDENLAGQKLAVYGNQTFVLIVAQIYGLELISPQDNLLLQLEERWTQRNIQLLANGALSVGHFPCFIKPLLPKSFPPGIYPSLTDFKAKTSYLKPDEEVLCSEIITDIDAEARCFILDNCIEDLAIYEGQADIFSARQFIFGFITNNSQRLPKTCVVDLAYTTKTGWFVLEFNASWGAGLNNCQAELVIDCIEAASIYPTHKY